MKPMRHFGKQRQVWPSDIHPTLAGSAYLRCQFRSSHPAASTANQDYRVRPHRGTSSSHCHGRRPRWKCHHRRRKHAGARLLLGHLCSFHSAGPGPGPGLDAINRAAIEYISDSLAKIKSSQTVELFSWVRVQMFAATTEAIYGPKNPFRDPTLEQAW